MSDWLIYAAPIATGLTSSLMFRWGVSVGRKQARREMLARTQLFGPPPTHYQPYGHTG